MSYNMKHAGVKRLMREAIEMKEPTDLYYAQPIDDENLFEWHFTVRGPPDTEFEDGIYHGRISFPPEYPMKPPSIFLLTKNGRFEVNKKICLSISGYHPETWLPSWSIRTALLAIIGFMPSKGEGAVGSLDYSPEERRNLAKYSIYFKCPKCGVHSGNVLKPMQQTSERCQNDLKEAKTLAENQYKPDNQESSLPSSSESAGTSFESNKPLPSSAGASHSDVSKSSLALEQENPSSNTLAVANDVSPKPSTSGFNPSSISANSVATIKETQVDSQNAIKSWSENSGTVDSPVPLAKSQQFQRETSPSRNMAHSSPSVSPSNLTPVIQQTTSSQRRRQNDSIPLIVSAFVVFVAIIVLVLRRASRWELWSEEIERQLSQP